MEISTIIIILVVIILSSSLILLFYKPKFKEIGGGMIFSNKKGDIKKLECSENAFITKVYGKYDNNNINYFGIECSDNKSPEPIGINEGSLFSNVSTDGFNKIASKEGDRLEYIKLFPINNNPKEFGTVKESSNDRSIECRKNEKLTSANLLSDNSKLVGLSSFSCGTDQSWFEYFFK